MNWRFWRRKRRLTPEEAYIEKLNSEAASREIEARHGVRFVPPGVNFVSISGGAIAANKIQAGSITANRITSHTIGE